MSGIPALRLSAQRLAGEPLPDAVEAVRWLGAVQSQDYPAAKWALAQRTRAATDADLDRLYDEGAILRTHVMRPTWHFVLPQDIRWLLELTAARLRATLAGRHRQLELDAATKSKAHRLFVRELGGGRAATRVELAATLARAGISPEGQRLPHLLHSGELEGLLTSGPRRGGQFTWALLEERAPGAPRMQREEALAELARRYFRSRGPAQLRDFTWWSGLTMADARIGIALAGNTLGRRVIDEHDYWLAQEISPARPRRPAAHLLPNFDEFTVAYRDRSALLHPDVPFDPTAFAYFRDSTPEGGLLSNVLTIEGVVRGSWRRTVRPKVISVDVRLQAPLEPRERQAVEAAADRLGRFYERPADLWITEAAPEAN